MSSTPNYGYKETAKICAMDAIDRELKRIEDLATRKGGHGCNCDCSGKVDQCEFDRHLVDPKAHKRLFDKKVDKEEGYSLISQECLEQICANKDGIVLLEQYIRELQERNDRLEAELENKVNVSQSGEWYEVELNEKFSHSTEGLWFSKSNAGDVYINGTFHSSAPPEANEVIFTLPEGYRPQKSTIHMCTSATRTNTFSWSTYVWILKNGEARFVVVTPELVENFKLYDQIGIDASFPVAQ